MSRGGYLWAAFFSLLLGVLLLSLGFEAALTAGGTLTVYQLTMLLGGACDLLLSGAFIERASNGN